MMAAKRLCPRLFVLFFAALLLNACMFDDDDDPSGGGAPVVTITIITPAGTEIDESTSLALSATAADPEEGDVSASLNWTSSIDGPLGTGPAISVSLSGGLHTITARAEDSFGQTGEDAITVSVDGAPLVAITAPAGDTETDDATSLDFSATAADPEDGDVSASLSWNSSIDGSLGTGPAISATLSVGVHTITATAEDSLGQDGSDTVTVAVTLAAGLRTMQSGGDEREYYLRLPADYAADADAAPAAIGDDTRKPLLFLYHGYTGSYENWVGLAPDYDPATAYYDLVEVVGDDAIVVVPNGLPNGAGERVWGGAKDLGFFADMLAELDRRGLQYNPNKIFVAGHSNGAGFTHELGCAYGDIIRGIVTAAGALTSTDCIGSTAVMLMQGSNDPLTSGSLALGTLSYWVLYNGWDKDASVPSTLGPCDDYSFPGELNSDYPVLWCEHTQGHDWPDFGSQTAWDFLSDLNEVEPTVDAPAGGGSLVATPPSDADLTFQLNVPADMNRPLRGVATLRPRSWIDSPTCSAPNVVLGTFSVDGKVIPGELSEPITVRVTYLDFSGQLQFPSEEYALSITVYVEGGSPGAIPTPGVDHDASAPISLVLKEAPVIMPEPLTLAPTPNLCG